MAVSPIEGQLWFNSEQREARTVDQRDVIHKESKNKNRTEERFEKWQGNL